MMLLFCFFWQMYIHNAIHDLLFSYVGTLEATQVLFVYMYAHRVCLCVFVNVWVMVMFLTFFIYNESILCSCYI